MTHQPWVYMPLMALFLVITRLGSLVGSMSDSYTSTLEIAPHV